MGEACSTFWGEQRRTVVFGEELQSKKLHGNSRRRWGIILKMIFKSGMRGA
jgi:hypothetical protein